MNGGKLLLEGRVVKSDMSKIPDDEYVAPVNVPLHSLFKRDIVLNVK